MSPFFDSGGCDVVVKNSVSRAGLALGFFFEVPPIVAGKVLSGGEDT